MIIRSLFVSAALVGLLVEARDARADVKLPSIFGDHMVLQQEAKVPVWGTADAGEKVTVTVGDHTASTTSGTDGKWRIDLAAFPNGAAATTMTVTGRNTITFQDVLVGEVWLASGQSNMWYNLEMAVHAHGFPLQDAAQNQATDAQLRFFYVAQKTSLEPLADVASPYFWRLWNGTNPRHSDGDHAGTWIVCEPHAAGSFSAIAYFFGRELRSHLNRPVGLIGAYWPGSVAEAWTSIAALQREPSFKTYLAAHQQKLSAYPTLEADYEKAMAAYLAEWKTLEVRDDAIRAHYSTVMSAWQEACAKAAAAGQPAPPKPSDPVFQSTLPTEPALPAGDANEPGALFNGMIAPIIPYAIKGVIWYQGESNLQTKAPEYRILFPRLIADWRERWDEGNFPFLYVQISHDGYISDGSSALLRETQLKTLSVPNTGMAVTVDIPDDDGVHPCDKLDPARRLALAARHIAYGEQLVYSGPLYQSMKVEGEKIRISFTNFGGGLIIGQTPYQPPTFGNIPITPYPTDKLIGFTIAGDDQKFVPATATIDGDTVVVSAPGISNPVAARLGWADVVQVNLYNKQMLPASPFRTDTWNKFTYTKPAAGTIPPSFGNEALDLPIPSLPHP